MAKKSQKSKKSTKSGNNEKKTSESIKSAKHPKVGSMLSVIIEKFPSEDEYSMDEILALIRESNQDMQNKKDSSLRTVIKELVKVPDNLKGKASPHINRYSFLKFKEATKKYQRV